MNRKFQKEQLNNYGQLTNEEATAMKALQNRLISPPVLALSRASGHLTLQMDSCNVQTGHVLFAKAETQKNKTGWLRVSVSEKARIDIRYNTARVSCHSMVRIYVTALLDREKAHNIDKS